MSKDFYGVILLSTGLLNGLGAALAAEPVNLLLIMSDNQSASLLGPYGNDEIDTPHTDRLAREGMVFERAYATSGVCSPSRATLMTGLPPSRHGIHNGLQRITIDGWSGVEEFRTLPQTLADAGYQTGLVGKWHLGVSDTPQAGFQSWVTFQGGHTSSFVDAKIYDNGQTYNVADTDEHLTDFWTRRAIDFLGEQDEDNPFFLMLSYNGPYMLPPTVNEPPTNRFAERYLDRSLTMPQEPLHPYLRQWAKEGTFEMPGVVGGMWGWAAIDALNNRNAMINVAAETTMVDDGMGRVLAELERLGLEENTLVVFLSDQGSAYGQLGLWGNTSWGTPPPAYNANMQVPLIFRHPGEIAKGKRRDIMIDQFDLLPTLLDYLDHGDKEIANSPGFSFAPVLRGEDINWENEVFFDYLTTRVIQTNDWKYTKRFADGPRELYDMKEDPGETKNLIDDPAHAGAAAQLETRLDAFFKDYADPEFDLWSGGTAKVLAFYARASNQVFADTFPDWREPFIEERPAFHD